MFNRKLLWRLGVPLVVIAILIAAIAMWPERSAKGTAEGEWTCSMHPQIRQNKPGQCPICGMNLIPVSQLSELTETEKRAGIETEPVKYRELFKEVRTVGKLDYNERRVAYITSRIPGRVDRLYADFTGIQVKKRDHLVDIYSPELVVAQDELIRAAAAFERGNSANNVERKYASQTLEAARSKLLLWNMLPEQVKEIEKLGKARTYLTIYAPIGGTIIEKSIRAGQYVKEGDLLYRIADLDPLWLYLDVYEYDLGWVRYGHKVAATVEAFPGQTFRGTVVFIDPFLDDRTRTVKVRVNVPNPERLLKPAMYASVVIRVRLLADGRPEPTGLEGKYMCPMHPEVVREGPGRCPVCEMDLERVPGQPKPPKDEHAGHAPEEHARHKPPPAVGQVLAVRASAVLDTGRRQIAYRQTEDGNFELVELKLGPRAEGVDDAGKHSSYYPVLAGVQPGDRLVVRGGFLLDSQRQIEGMPSLLYPQGQGPATLHGDHALPKPPPAQPGTHKH